MITEWKPVVRGAVYAALVLSVVVWTGGEARPFIYFQVLMRTRRIPRGIVVLGTMILVFAGAEVTARVASRRLPAVAGQWPNPVMAAKYEQMITYAERERTFDVLFVGSSMTVNGIDPVRFSDRSGLSSYNAAFPAASPRTLRPWVLDIAEPLLSPRMVVLGVSSRELNDNGRTQRSLYRAFTSSPGYRQATARVNRIEGRLERASYFLRFRRQFRHPARLLRDLLRGRSDWTRRYNLIRRNGTKDRPPGSPAYMVRAEWRANQRKNVLNDYAGGGRGASRLA